MAPVFYSGLLSHEYVCFIGKVTIGIGTVMQLTLTSLARAQRHTAAHCSCQVSSPHAISVSIPPPLLCSYFFLLAFPFLLLGFSHAVFLSLSYCLSSRLVPLSPPLWSETKWKGQRIREDSGGGSAASLLAAILL